MFSNTLTGALKLAGTDTFRRSSSKLLGHYGGNVQNPTPSLMKCVVPPRGYIFLQPDQSGAEALIVAMEAPRGKFRETFDVGMKVHSYTALQLFAAEIAAEQGTKAERYKGISPKTVVAYPEYKKLFTDIKNNSKRYDLGKRVRHARNYGMGPKTLQLNCLEMSEGTINLSYQESKGFLATDEEVFPEINYWQAMIRAEAAKDRTLRNLFGYPKYFGGVWSNSLERKLYAFKPQSTVGIITALAITDMYNYIAAQRLPWYVLNDKHDSFLLTVPDNPEHRNHGAAKCKEYMERHLVSSSGEHFQMRSGLSIGHNWAKHDEVTNPNGMKEI